MDSIDKSVYGNALVARGGLKSWRNHFALCMMLVLIQSPFVSMAPQAHNDQLAKKLKSFGDEITSLPPSTDLEKEGRQSTSPESITRRLRDRTHIFSGQVDSKPTAELDKLVMDSARTETQTDQLDDTTNELSVQQQPAPQANSSHDEIIEDGLCSLLSVPRKSLLATRSDKSELTERALVCSRVADHNYNQMLKSFYDRGKLDIEQIHIVESEPLVVFPAIDLICSLFDCYKLTVFNMSNHQVHDYNKLADWVSKWPQIEVLDLSTTALKSVESILSPVDSKPSYVMENLTHLHLNTNNITELNFNLILERMPALKHLELANNEIFNIICDSSLQSRVRSQFESISLANNSINCDKSQLWFIRQFQNPVTIIKFPEHDKINCNQPTLAEMTWAQRLSVLETKICDDCECRSVKRTDAISVDCHRKNLTALPDELPLNTKILNLTSNHIGSLWVPSNSTNWENVTYLYLVDNWIASFLPMNESKFMKNLAALDVRQNKIQELPDKIFEHFSNLDQIHLSNNPWYCECVRTVSFQEWLQRQFHKVGDKEDIRCGVSGLENNGLRSSRRDQRLSSRVIYRLSKSELCPQDNLDEPYDWLDVVNFTLGISIILILTKVTLDYIYQHRTKRLPHFFKLNY